MKRLCRRLDIPLYQAVGLLEVLWHTTARQQPRGDIGYLTNEDIAIAIDYRGDENVLIEALVSTGWLDEHSEHRLVVHDWAEHADDALHMRLARAKLRFVNGSTPKTVRLPPWERKEADEFFASVRTEKESVRTASARRDHGVRVAPPEPRQSPAPPEPRLLQKQDPGGAPSMRFEEWWVVWQNGRGTNHRMNAEQVYPRVVTVEMEQDCFECTKSYCASLNGTGGYNPENFLIDQGKDKFKARFMPAKKRQGVSTEELAANIEAFRRTR